MYPLKKIGLIIIFSAVACCPSCRMAAPTVDTASPTTVPAASIRPTSAAAATAPAPEAPAEGVLFEMFPNGLTAIVKPSHAAPVVTVRGYIRAGSLYEGPWLGSGIGHLTEHLLAGGAEHLMDGQAPPSSKPAKSAKPDRVAAIGGQANAYTSLDHACYHISAASGRAAECIDLIADWLTKPEFDESDFRREHGVVQRELEMGKDNPERQLWFAHSANIFLSHPAAAPTIGLEAPLAALTYKDLRNYYQRMYVPQNMVFVVAGDVDGPAAMKLLRKALGGLPAQRPPELMLPAAPPIVGVRRVVKEHPSLTETLQEMSFAGIPLLNNDLYALDVLSDILSEGPSSRLFERIQRQRKLVTSISTSSWTPAWGRGVFSISFRSPADGADAAEKAILAELKAVVESGVTEEELARAKRQKVAEFVYAQQTVDSQAATIGSDYLSTGDLNFSRDYTTKIQAVTADAIRAAANKYFQFNNMVVTRLTPPTRAATTSAPATMPQQAGATAFTMPNGLRVVLQPIQPSGEKGLASMALVTEGGLLLETEKINGLGTLMSSLSTKGAGGLTAEEIAKFFGNAGGSLSAVCGNNTFYWQGTVLDDSFKRALEIFSDVVCRPDFDPNELEIIRPVQMAAIAKIDEQWQSQLDKFYRQKFFTNSPYGMLPSGNTSVVKKAAAEQVRQHYRRCILAGGSVLTIYGHFDPREARPMVEKLFSAMPPGRVALEFTPPRKADPKGEGHFLKTDNKVAGVIVAAPGMKIGNVDDRIAIDVLDTIISGYHLPSGWLHDELRGKQLVYVVHAYNWAGLAPGAFVTYAACQPEKAGEVVDIIQRDLRKAADYLPTQGEVDQAVNSILTAEVLENQSIPELALSAALDELYGLGYDYHRRIEGRYRALKPADIREVGRKYLSDGYVTVVTSPVGDMKLNCPPPTESQPTSGIAGRPSSSAPASQSGEPVPTSKPAALPAASGAVETPVLDRSPVAHPSSATGGLLDPNITLRPVESAPAPNARRAATSSPSKEETQHGQQ